jgi:TolA-binding protein
MKLRFAYFLLLIFCSSSLGTAQDTKQNADFKLAVNLFNDRLYDLALEQFQQFINRNGNSQQAVEARFYLGQTQVKLGRFDDARFTFQNFALSYPDDPRAPQAWWNVADAYAVQKNYHEAAVAFDRIRVFHPKSKLASAGLVKASENYELAGDKAGAEKMLRALLQDYAAAEGALAARMKLAELSLADEQFETARAEAQRLASGTKDPEQKIRAQLLLARALVGLGKYREAQSALSDILKNPHAANFFEAQFVLGSLKKQSGAIPEALAAWKIIIADSARAPAALRQQALLETGGRARSQNDYATALPYFERAANIKAGLSGQALYLAAVTAEKMKQSQKAADYYARALRDSSRNIDLKTLVVGAFKGAILSQNFHEAIRLASSYHAQFPTDELVPRLLVEAATIARLQLNDQRQAVDLYRQVLSEYPTSQLADEALFGVGLAMEQSGDFDEALRTLESLERRFPSNDFVEQARDAVKRIQLFELKSRETGVEKLALLIGDVIAQKSRGDLSFRLAEIYFHELKDYEHASQYFRAALDAGVDAKNEPSAWYYRAKGYEYVAWKAEKEKPEHGGMIARACDAYEELLKRFPSSDFSDDAIVALTTLKLNDAPSIAAVSALSVSLAKNYPKLQDRESLLLQVGKAFRKLKGDAEAAGIFRTILQSRKQPETAEAMFQLALVLNDTGKKDSAYTLLQSFLQSYPLQVHRAQAAWTAGQIASQRGQVQEAMKAYDLIEQQYPYTSFMGQLTLARADAHLAAGNFPGALEWYQRYLSQLERDVYSLPEPQESVLLKLAQCYRNVGNRTAAKQYYAAYLAVDPSSQTASNAYAALSSIAREENNLELAANYLREAGKYSAGSTGQRVDANLEIGDLLFRGEAYADAVVRYQETARQTTIDSVRQYALGRTTVCYFRLNKTNEAEKQASLFLKTYPNAVSAAAEFEFERGRSALRAEEIEKARHSFEAVVKSYGDLPVAVDAQYWLGRVLETAGRTADARKLYETIIEKYPDHAVTPRARLSLGNIFYAAEQWDPAARQYKAILDSEQRAPDLVSFAMNNLILSYKELSLFDGALELTRKYIERFPDDPELIKKRIDLGVLYQKLGYYDQAVVHLQSLIDGSDPDLEGELRYYIGEAYYGKGEYQQAILEFLKVPYLVTRRTNVDWVATSFYMSGQAYEKMSKFDQAISMYKQIIERPNIDAQFKSAAQKEIDRVNTLVKSQR